MLIILEIWDDVRRDACTLYGYNRWTTPNLNALAAEGAKLDGVSLGTWTFPAMSAILYGRDPAEIGRATEGPPSGNVTTAEEWAAFLVSLPSPGTNIFSEMKARGFRTVWLCGGGYAGKFSFPSVEADFYEERDGDGPFAALLEIAAKWDGKENAFCLVHSYQAHGPWSKKLKQFCYEKDRWIKDPFEPPTNTDVVTSEDMAGAGLEKMDYWRRLYDGAIRACDKHLWRLRECLLKKDVFLAVTADHGERITPEGVSHGGTEKSICEVPLVLWGERMPKPKPAGMVDHLAMRKLILETAT